MRLIDADRIETKDVIGGNSEFANDVRMAMQDLIDAQPTAYDVDEVVEQLEEQANQYHERANQYALKGIDRQVEHMAGKACSYEYSIEIVKAGGVSDNH